MSETEQTPLPPDQQLIESSPPEHEPRPESLQPTAEAETTGTGTIVAIGCVALVIVVTLVAILILTIVS